MTITVYVYAPVSGTIVATPNGYCSGGSHPYVCQRYPYDISCSAGAAIQFKASSVPAIQSIRTTYTGSGVCYRGSEIPTPWDAKLMVEFFLQPNAVELVGIVCYAHVNSPVSNNVYNVNTKVIGYIPSNCGCACASGCKCGGYNNRAEERGYCADTGGNCAEKCPCRCCYGGPHTHMEADFNAILGPNNCNGYVSTSSWMYKWFY